MMADDSSASRTVSIDTSSGSKYTGNASEGRHHIADAGDPLRPSRIGDRDRASVDRCSITAPMQERRRIPASRNRGQPSVKT
jgi:hypothetical protein